MRKAVLRVAGITALAIALVGCGSGGTSTGVSSLSPSRGGSPQQAAVSTNSRSTTASTSAGGPCRPREYLSFCEKIHIAGAVTVDGTGSAVPQFDQGPAGMAQKCTTWPTYQPSKLDDHDLALPDDPVDGHKVLMLWPFAAGVGTSDIAGYAGSNSIAVDGVGFVDVATDVSHTTASSGQVRVNPDGSGSLTFKEDPPS